MRPLHWCAVSVLTITFAIACSGSNASPTASPIPTPVYHRPSPTTAAPTFAPPPEPTPNASAMAIRPCRSGDLVVHQGMSGAATGHAILSFWVANVSSTACRVHGGVGIDVLDADGNVDRMGAVCGSFATDRQTCGRAVTVLEPGPEPVPAAGPYAATFNIEFVNPANAGQSCPNTSRVAIELPDGGGRIDVGDIGMPDCAWPGSSELRTEPPSLTPVATVGYR